MRTFTQAVYGVFGGTAFLAALGAFVAPELVLSGATLTPLTTHLIREQAAGFVFIGLMFFWCMRHFDQRRYVHFALVAFTVVFAGIHWADYLKNYGDIWLPVVNSIPVVVLALTAPRHVG